MREYNTIIVGAGAAGLLAAYARSLKNKDILVLEKNSIPGRKVLITGKGRCNITNAGTIENIIDMTTTNGNFLYSSLYTFTNDQLIDYIESYGTMTKVERGQRVFPKSDKSQDVVDSIIRSIQDIDINYNENVIDIKKEDNFCIKTNRETYYAENLIIATGGITYPGTGSTGDGYQFAKLMGHTVIKPVGSLIPMKSNLKDIGELSGLSVKNASIKLYADDSLIAEEFGDFLFTHSGLSGPIILKLSDVLAGSDYDNIRLECDFKPKVRFEQLDNRLINDIEANPRQMLKTLIPEYFPRRFGEYLLESVGIDIDTRLHEIDRKMRHKIINMMKSYDLKYSGLVKDSYGIITKGGIKTTEIDPSTMESKLVRDLYFAGEVLDVSALTGGYNLQIAFSTGYLAGKSIN